MHGIYADSRSYSSFGYSDLRITTATVTGENIGVFARNDSTGFDSSSLIIDTTAGSVEGKNGAGLYAANLGYSAFGYTQLSVTTGDVTGAVNGIEAKGGAEGSYGGNVTLDTTAGFVKGTSGIGISVVSENEVDYGTTNLTITTANVEGAVGGISATNRSDGNSGSLLTIETSLGGTPGTVRGGYGIRALNETTSDEGATTLTVRTADVTATTGVGVFARNSATSELDANVIVDTSAGAVNAVNMGVYASAVGTSASGNIDVTITTGDVTSTGSAVLGGVNGTSETGANVTIDTAAGAIVSRDGQGVYALVGNGVRTNGSSDITIATGDVTAEAGRAVQAFMSGTSGTGANITIDTIAGAIVSRDGQGVYALVGNGVITNGSSDITITTGDVTADADRAVEVLMIGTSETGANVTINTTAGDIFSRDGQGVYGVVLREARTNGNSDTTITTGDVTAEGTAVLGGVNGTSETGANVTINTTAGDIVSRTRRGIWAFVDSAVSTNGNSDISITTGDVTAEQLAIFAEFSSGGYAKGSKKITIDTTDGVVTSSESFGIGALRGRGSGDITITTADVNAVGRAISVFSNYGGSESNNVIVDTTAGTVTVRDVDSAAIDVVTNVVESYSGSTDMRIRTADVVGGVRFVNNSRAELSADVVIDTTSGSVSVVEESLGPNGISGRSYSITRQGSANLTITTADVTSNSNAINVENRSDSMGSANLTIDTLAGSIASTEGTGILVDNRRFGYRNTSLSGTTNLQITTADVSGARDGIFAHNRGESATGSNLIIDTRGGEVSGLDGAGIYAANSGSASAGTTDLSLTVGNVIGSTNGVHAVQHTDGDLTFRSDGGAPGTVVGGYLGYGLNAVSNGMGATDIALTNSGVFGNIAGVFADHGTSTGAFTIDMGRRAVIGNSSDLSSDLAIRARSEVTGLTLTNQAGGVLVGTLDLTAQDDVFNNAGTWRTAGGVNDFGGGTDVLNNSSLQTLVVGSGAANQVTFMNNLELFNNAGRVTFVDGFASDTLVLSGNFDGTGGVMEMEFDTTTLASDLLVVNGDVLGGPTTVVLTGIGGAGGLTGTNQNDGISLVQVAGTTSAADFQLAGSAQVDVFVYDSLSLGSDNVWRVQSAFLPSINGYEVYPSALLNMTKLAPYRDRLGARQVSMGQNGTQAWLQMDGTWLERDQEGSISGTSFEQNFTEITAGVDFATQGALTAGVNLRFSEGNTSINGPSGASTIKTEGYGIGGSLTWHLAGGVYVDTQAGYMAFSSDLPGNADNSGHGLATSVEVGRSFALPSDGWSMTQRAQLSYSMVDFDDMTGSFGEKVRLRDGESLTGRFGLALNRDWSGANGAANSVFGAMDLVHEVMPDTAVDVTVLNTTTFARSAAPNRIEFGLGGKIGLSETSYLHGALAVAQDFGDSDSQQISANFGFNIRW